MIRQTLIAASFTLLTSVAAQAACAYENEVPLKSLTAGFEAWKAVTDAMAECGNFTPELDQEFIQKQASALAAEPALYHIAGVANESIVPLVNDGLIRPLDDLVEKYGENLQPNQLIRIDGQVMGIAMMVNAQHLMYRSDIFDELGIEVPETYDDMTAAAETIAEADVVDYPIGATFRTGWNLSQDFVNLFMGHGGEFFDEENNATVNSEAGVAALETMKSLTEYMDPEYLVADSTYVQQQFQQGRIAMANLWASRAGAMNDEAESDVVGKVVMAAAPAAVEGSPPATTVWWDGLTIAQNITDEEADAAFRLIMEGLDSEMVEANNDAAVWLVQGYEPTDLAAGTVASAEGGAPAFPASTAMGIMHGAIGNNIASFLTGSASAEEALAAVEAEYATGAREAGLIQ